MIASSHWTSGEASIRKLSAFNPAALTLKTTSAKFGGTGSDGTRDKRALINQFGDTFAIYTDGPKTLELWDLTTTSEMSHMAREVLGADCALGLSILQGEDYEDIASVLNFGLYQYVELNWKYSFRNLAQHQIEDRGREIVADLSRFLQAFKNLPKLVKLSRESLRFRDQAFFAEILGTVAGAGAGIIVANSQKMRVPPSRLQANARELFKGVVVGEHLFLDTYNAIRELRPKTQASPPLNIVASGGVMDLGSTIDVIAAGANAVQLCSALDVRGAAILELLREQLAAHCEEYGDFQALVNALRSSDAEWWDLASVVANETRNLEETVFAALARTDLVLADAAETLVMESTLPEPDEAESRFLSADLKTRPERLKGAIMVQGRGNVLTAYVSGRVARELGMEVVSMDSSSTLRSHLFAGRLKYDFAILARSGLDYMASMGKSDLDENEPVEIGRVGRSYVELVGDSEAGLESIRVVHHFGGVSGHRAVENFWRSIRKNISHVQINSTELLPTLRFWRTEAAILAKPPISRLYRFLTKQDLAARWKPLWSWSEDLLLVARKGILQDADGEAMCGHVLTAARAAVTHAKENPREAATECLDGSFFWLLARLLGGRP